MLKSFLLSYKIKNTYRVNAIIYSLKNMPLVKKIIPSNLYKSKGLKTFVNIISGIIELLSIFLGKFLYLLIMVFAPLTLYKNHSLGIITIFVFLTLVGALFNTHLFNPTKDKYYSIVLMRFNAKKYVLSNYYYFILKTIIGFLPFTIILGNIEGLNIFICILMPFFVINIKNIFNATVLYFSDKKNKYKNENTFIASSLICALIFLIIGYGLPYLGLGINENMFIILFIISLVLSIFAFTYIIKFNKYTRVYKEILKKDDVLFNTTATVDYTKVINDDIVSSNKEGYAYFNDVFVKRHKKILTKPSKQVTFISIILSVILIIACYFNTKGSESINYFLKNSLPYFLFVMYFVNRGEVITKTMFMNCDHSMLVYKFYREPSSILSLFKERLKTLIKLNIVPGIVIGLSISILLYVTGGVPIYEYVISTLTIVSISIFFSVHYLVMYYLLQPYSIDLEIKNPTFMAVNSITYFICFIAINVKLPIMVFGILMIIFTILYSFISLFIVYKYASKTFKLK